MGRLVLISLVAASIETFLLCAVAWADHPQLDEAARHLSEAAFEDALDAIERVEAADHLTREEVVRMLVLSSLVHHALGNEGALDASLTGLVSLEPGHTFDANVPPEVQSRFEEIRGRSEGPLDLEVEARRIRGGFQIDARISGDVASLVEDTEIYVRLPGDDWVRTAGRRASIPHREEGAVEYYAVALGLGGAVLSSDGTEENPHIIGAPGEGAPRDLLSDDGEPGTVPPVEEVERERRRWPWALFGVGLAAIIAGAVVAAVLLSRQNQGTQLDAPTVDWP